MKILKIKMAIKITFKKRRKKILIKSKKKSYIENNYLMNNCEDSMI